MATAVGINGSVIYDVTSNTTIYKNNDTTVLPAAGLINLPIVLAVYNKGKERVINLADTMIMEEDYGGTKCEDRSIGSTYTLSQLCNFAIRCSDKTAANMLLDKLNETHNNDAFGVVNGYMEALGAGNTKINRYLMTNGTQNETTPADMQLLLTQLAKKELPGSDDILGYMQNHYEQGKIGEARMPGAIIYNVTGTLNGYEHDAAIIEIGEQRYVFVFMGKFTKTAIANAAQKVYDQITQPQP
jgi:beta-lactamase class A